MNSFPEGYAVVYCEGAFGTPNGKTAHGLVRRTRRYRIVSVIDSQQAGQDAGQVLDGKSNGIPIYADLDAAIADASQRQLPLTHFVIGLAPDGGRLSDEGRRAIRTAIGHGLDIDSGLHSFISEDPDLVTLAIEKGVTIRDVRRPPGRETLHFFSGKIEEVSCLKVAVLGTDSAIGKRTTAWLLVDALEKAGYPAELIGTGQTAWMQGVSYGIMLDSLVNDFVSGEIEHAIWTGWRQSAPKVIVLEGQGSLMNPAYPGGMELLAAGRPDAVILQHAPARKEYDGFPGYLIHPLAVQIQAIELLSGKPVVAITINHENLAHDEIAGICQEIHRQTGLPTCAPLIDGAETLVTALVPYLSKQ